MMPIMSLHIIINKYTYPMFAKSTVKLYNYT